MDAVGPLLIISRKNLLAMEALPGSDSLFRRLASLSRRGIHILLTAPEPDHWLPTRGHVDDALAEQGRLQQAVQAFGGDLDGVYYVPRSSFTQDRNREGALKDILERYGVGPDKAMLVSSSRPFLRSARNLGINSHDLPKAKKGFDSLKALLDGLKT